MKMSNITSEILARFFEGRTTSEENNAIADWIESDPANQETFNRELQFHLMLMHMPASVQTPRQKPHRTRLALYVGLAASFVAGIILCWFLAVAPLSDEASRMVAFHTDPGQRASLTLSDGTSVELNSASTLEYPAVFARGERRVRVEGEAMFDVAKVADKPFYVETFAYDVRVLGTKFNIIADEQTGEFSTALLEGKVSVMDKAGIDRAILLPSQMVSLEEGALKLSTIRNIEEEHLWTEGILSVAGVPFDKLVQRMERCYGVNIVVEKDKMPSVRYRRMKVRISDGIEFALNAIQRESDFEWHYDDLTHTYYIY